MDAKNRKCKNCGTENPLKADFCSECGTRFNEKIDAKGSNPISRGASSWNKRSKRFKITTGILGCCVGAFIIIMILAAIFPVTSLSLDNTSVNIDNQTTAYMLKGNTEANATVEISSTVLNLNNVEVKPDANGNFEYEVQIPLNVNTSDVLVTAKSTKKSENTATLTINRPSNSPSTPQNTGTPNKTYSDQNISFNYPNNWQANPNGIPNFATGNAAGNLEDNVQIDSFSISEYAQGDSEDPAIPATMESVVNNLQSQKEGTYTKENITVDGLNGLEYTDLTPDPNEQGAEYEFVYFAKGDTLYEIDLSTTNYDADKTGMDMILKTFQVKQ